MLKFAKNKTEEHQSEPIIPTKAHVTDAGYDLYATNAYTLYRNQSVLIKTGIHAAIPEGFYGRVADRSGMAVKGARVGAGVIDSAYRGEIKVLLTNINEHGTIEIQPGDRVAQLIIAKIYDNEMAEVSLSELNSTIRGSGGFGSSGR